MKTNAWLLLLLLAPAWANAQTAADSAALFKKRVLEAPEIALLSSFYSQEGQNAAVTGGIGTEELTDLATEIGIYIPVSDDGVLSISGTVSAYTSASSSNLNPFSGASESGDDDDDDDDKDGPAGSGATTGTPWAASTGASRQDVWANLNLAYSHSSDDRNTVCSGSLSLANEYDYGSLGFGLGLARLLNQKNTEISIHGNVFLDKWRPEYPTEIKTFVEENGNLDADFFQGVPILDINGMPIAKTAPEAWRPVNNSLVENKGRNTFALSLGFHQILGKKTQMSISTDLTYQEGWLANPMQRVYFADRPNFFIGEASDIPVYATAANDGVFQLADDIERLPLSRLKVPIGLRLNQYVNEFVVLRGHYRYYFDDWGIRSHTLNVEMALKLGMRHTLYPSYRLYTQTAADYFAGYEQALSTSQFHSSDFDLAGFMANQFGLAYKYTDIFTSARAGRLGLKSLSLDYSYYFRDSGFEAHILSFGTSLVID